MYVSPILEEFLQGLQDLRDYWNNWRAGKRAKGRAELRLMENSCPHQAQQEDLNREVQGPMPKTPLHARLEGLREGREAEAIAATQYVLPKLFCFFANPYLDLFMPIFPESRAIGIEVICYIVLDVC
jgi:hypothetical protein